MQGKLESDHTCSEKGIDSERSEKTSGWSLAQGSLKIIIIKKIQHN